MQINQREWMIPVSGGEQVYLKEKWPDVTERGPVVLMVHGYNALGHLGNYDVPVKDFSGMEFLAARGYDVFALDMRGFGQSSRPESITMEDNIADVHAAVTFILEERGVERLSLLGGSYGGPIAFTYASRHPDLLERLILLATAYQYFPPAGQAMKSAIKATAEEHKLAYVSMPVSREADATVVETEQAFLDWRFEAAQSHDLSVPVRPLQDIPPSPDDASKAVRAVTTPTLLVLGDKDVFADVEDNIKLLSDLGATEKSLIIVGNAGHALMYETRRNYIWSLVSSGLPPVAAAPETD